MKTKFTVTVWLGAIDAEYLWEQDFDTFDDAKAHADFMYSEENRACTIWRNGCRVMDIG